ncbi:bifunctional nicotinamide mononucleotide adenylyltransferase/ ADP-ribose pyrophosphatase [Ruegeria phage RpAliso]|nr:bifunctional nicotinamide mononucleotide adenylyltransferase/ ADP-ribose pyrophosphatase [Ruegeria phage RpAliso]
MDYDVLAFIGRFHPFHIGHQVVVDTALSRAKKVAIVLGSHDQPRNVRNPFTSAERIEMITAVYPNEVAEGRIVFVPQADWVYSLDRWVMEVQAKVTQVANTPYTPDPVKIGLIGHSKDHTSFYLRCFPTWESIEVANVDGIDATAIRADIFHHNFPFGGAARGQLPDAVEGYLDTWIAEKHEDYFTIVEETDFVRRYKQQFDAMPYPPTFNTVDAVVVQSGHVLLVRRGAMPGKGLWAIPGGFLDQNETLLEGAVRELREETRIAVPDPVLRGSVKGQRTFDDPNRSQRGRTLTTAFMFRLQDREDLPKIKGSDDADKACWVPLSELKRSMMFEDHFDIITEMAAL